jgi:hypothetical protein
MLENIITSGKKWNVANLKGTERICFTDGWTTDWITIYDNGTWASDFPQYVPQYIKNMLEKSIEL